MTSLYLAQARKRAAAIKMLAQGKPREHVYTQTASGKVCVGCGHSRAVLRGKACRGDLYDGDAARLLILRDQALGVSQLENQELLRRLEIADTAISAVLADSESRPGGWGPDVTAQKQLHDALASIRAATD